MCLQSRLMGTAFAAFVALNWMCDAGAAPRNDPSTAIAVDWVPEAPKPEAVSLDDASSRLKLQLDAVRRQFKGTYKYPHPGDGEIWRATLSANFEDKGDLWLPLRLHEGLSLVTTTIYNPTLAACTFSVMGPINEPSRSVDETLRRYFTAQVALAMSGPNQCGPKMRRRVRDAWCDRWLDLATLKSYYDVDDHKIQACGKKRASVPLNRRLLEVRYARFKFQLDWRNAASANGDQSLVTKINASLVRKLVNDGSLRALVQSRDGITVDQLRAGRGNRQGAMISQLESLPNPFLAASDNAVTLTSTSGLKTFLITKPDGTYWFSSNWGAIGTGKWVLRENNTRYCTTPDGPVGVSVASESCATILRFGEKLELVDDSNERMTVEVNMGAVGLREE